ncbi:MAG TPA: YggS family pyridoxal phosphate-dependent enzyme, partial [Verrucomicrobiae bacterium]|nr:YggS family pyridoxal phosphate-dependent enzyme [Verrucomicrobiae bacterium]
MDIAGNLNLLRERIRAACDRCKRGPDSVTLLAVTKSQPPEMIRAAADGGQLLFGENKVQEAKAK